MDSSGGCFHDDNSDPECLQISVPVQHSNSQG